MLRDLGIASRVIISSLEPRWMVFPVSFPGRMCNLNDRNKPERRIASSVMQAPLKRDRASSTLSHVQKALKATADQEALYPTNISQEAL